MTASPLPPPPALVERAAAWVAGARRILCVTGAGVSAESGLPTYRGVGGIYDGVDTDDGIAIEEALSGPVFRRAPETTWKYLLQIERACRGATPNAAHEILARWSRDARPPAEVWVLSQNVDGLHSVAGSRHLIEIHGDLHRLRCTTCDWRDRVDDYEALSPLPTCPNCGALIRPEVVLFEETLPSTATRRLHAQLALGFDLVFSIGTSSQFPYIVQPVVMAKHQGLPTVEINPRETAISALVDLRLPCRAGLALEAIDRVLGGAP